MRYVLVSQVDNKISKTINPNFPPKKICTFFKTNFAIFHVITAVCPISSLISVFKLKLCFFRVMKVIYVHMNEYIYLYIDVYGVST